MGASVYKSMDAETRHALLSEISDDYESVETIDGSLRFHGLDSLVTHEEIAEALKQLIEEGLAQAYQLSPHPPHTQQVDFDAKLVEQLWFYVTPKGKEIVKTLDAQLDGKRRQEPTGRK